MRKAKILFVLGCLIGLLNYAYAQRKVAINETQEVDSAFAALVRDFRSIRQFSRSTLKLPLLYQTGGYEVRLADSALNIPKQRLVLTNPFGADAYPLSYSVIYQNCLVSLFAPGYFACYTIEGFQRNLPLEEQLNTKQFEKHWLLDGYLVGLSSGSYWQYSPGTGWEPYSKQVPFKDRPKLYEDKDYLVYNECRGEFGGQIYFYHKRTQKTYSTESVCAVRVSHSKQGYEVLSNLGHGTGHTRKVLIRDPRKLPKVSDLMFDLYSIELFGGFKWQNQDIYLLNLAGYTHLATLSDRIFVIVDPLFNGRLYTHRPLSTDYGSMSLINLDHYGTGKDREVACMVTRGDQIVVLNWHELHRW
ncbi:hypothetical protein [Telluribacter sp. SYSU D00476]|uniref:hypothetical protein n=1 Tax=Telluribacter sp. SYSU D00476 TaxID=2811430 RepID=UPI001FF1DE95|nr:hypothetical protein [Telluribacter sp. SYSU D00476]